MTFTFGFIERRSIFIYWHFGQYIFGKNDVELSPGTSEGLLL